jgi:transposase
MKMWVSWAIRIFFRPKKEDLKMTQETQTVNTASTRVLYMAMELSKKTWKLGFNIGGQRHRIVNVDAGDLLGLEMAIGAARERFRLPLGVAVKGCYEAGRDGFWIHRALTAMGIENVIVDPASIEVNRRGRRAKSDRIDVKKLLKKLVQYHEGDQGCWSVVRIPSIQDEDERRPHRELERLKKERTGHRSRIQALLFAHGPRLKPGRGFLAALEAATQWDGEPLPAKLKEEAKREYERLLLVEKQIKALEGEISEHLKSPNNRGDEKAAQLTQLKGIGLAGGWVLSKELFAWRSFNNRKELGGLVGLTPTPFNSGDGEREQGISKSGSRRIRCLMVQLAWAWLRFQPRSNLTLWFNERYGAGTKRSRRVGIVALARRLLIALWRFVERGVVPEGAALS